jgi:hypothetical protein
MPWRTVAAVDPHDLVKIACPCRFRSGIRSLTRPAPGGASVTGILNCAMASGLLDAQVARIQHRASSMVTVLAAATISGRHIGHGHSTHSAPNALAPMMAIWYIDVACPHPVGRARSWADTLAARRVIQAMPR